MKRLIYGVCLLSTLFLVGCDDDGDLVPAVMNQILETTYEQSILAPTSGLGKATGPTDLALLRWFSPAVSGESRDGEVYARHRGSRG